MRKNIILQQFLQAETRQLRAAILAHMTPHILGLYRSIIEQHLCDRGDDDLVRLFLQVHSAFMQATGKHIDAAFLARQGAVTYLQKIASGEVE